MANKMCCDVLTLAIEYAGDSGISIAVATYKGAYSFRLQSRGVSFSDIAVACTKSSDPRDLVINLCSEQVIHFCPWCGTRLSELKGIDDAWLSGVVSRHAPLIRMNLDE